MVTFINESFSRHSSLPALLLLNVSNTNDPSSGTQNFLNFTSHVGSLPSNFFLVLVMLCTIRLRQSKLEVVLETSYPESKRKKYDKQRPVLVLTAVMFVFRQTFIFLFDLAFSIVKSRKLQTTNVRERKKVVRLSKSS